MPAGTRPRSLISMPAPWPIRGPCACRRRRRGGGRGLRAWPCRRPCGHAPCTAVDIAQFVGVRGAEVDFVVRAVEAEADGPGRFPAVDVVNEKSLDLLGHKIILNARQDQAESRAATRTRLPAGQPEVLDGFVARCGSMPEAQPGTRYRKGHQQTGGLRGDKTPQQMTGGEK